MHFENKLKINKRNAGKISKIFHQVQNNLSILHLTSYSTIGFMFHQFI